MRLGGVEHVPAVRVRQAPGAADTLGALERLEDVARRRQGCHRPPLAVARLGQARDDHAALGRAVTSVDDGVGLDRRRAARLRDDRWMLLRVDPRLDLARVDAAPAVWRRRAAEDGERVLRAAPAEA